MGSAVTSIERLLRPRLRPGQNYLLLQYQAALGTVVHATPLVEALRQAAPAARIVVASGGLAAQVWQGNPWLERLLLTPSPLQDLPGAVRALRSARLFDGQPWTTLLTTGNERIKITLAALLAGPSRRVGFAVQGPLLHQHLRWNPALSQIDNNLRLLQTILPAAQLNGLHEPRINPTQAGPFADAALLHLRPHRVIALATQTSITQRKQWRAERWVALAHALHEQYDAELLFLGTTAESDAIDRLRETIAFPTTSLAGKTTVPQLAAVLQQCTLGVMLDTGPLHVARAVGLPVVVIAPAWSPPHEWLPVGNPRYRILKNRDFPPPAPPDYIIDEVSVADVLAATQDLLRS